MARTNPFDAALKEARKALQDAYAERAAIEQRIISLTTTIEGLVPLCEPEIADEFLLTASGDVSLFQVASLTDAIRRVFSESKRPMLTPTEVRDALVAMGLDLSKYKQPLVPIHNTLKRLVSQEELVEFRDDKNELKGYQWVEPLARAVREVRSPKWMETARAAMRRNTPAPHRALYGDLPDVPNPFGKTLGEMLTTPKKK